MLSVDRIEEVIKSYQTLIQQESYFGQEGEVVSAIKAMVRHYQLDDIHVDKYGNIVGGIVGSQPGKALALDGHIDTVSVNEEKRSRNPYGDDIEDSKIYDRGTTNMKGAVVVMISAVSFFGQNNQRNFAGKIYVACIVHEECFEGVAVRLISGRYRSDYVITGEASELDLRTGQRGRTEIVARTFGKPAHSANPQAGIDAAYKMAQLIDKVHTTAPPTHPVLGSGILELADTKSSLCPGVSVISDYYRVTYDRRLLADETKESVTVPLENTLAELIAQGPQSKARVSYAVGQESCHTGAIIEGGRLFPGWVYDESDESVQVVLVGTHEAGSNPTIMQYSFCTNGSHCAGETGIKIIDFDPSQEGLVHTTDEYIEIGQLIGSASGYYSTIQTLHRQ